MSASISFSVLPYAQATPRQHLQALHSARQVLAAAYPLLADLTQGAAALDQVQPLLLLGPDVSVQLAQEGLAALARYLALPPPVGRSAGEPAAAATPHPGPAGADRPQTTSLAAGSLKQTYTTPVDLREQLRRVSYWLHVPVAQLVVHGLTELVGKYPEEAARPIPPRTPLS